MASIAGTLISALDPTAVAFARISFIEELMSVVNEVNVCRITARSRRKDWIVEMWFDVSIEDDGDRTPFVCKLLTDGVRVVV